MFKLDSKIAVLMLLIIIEVMGIGIVFPMLPELFIAKNSILLANTTTVTVRHLCYGISIALWPLGMFFGTPFLGEVSDKIGRKKIFLLCLSMTALSYGLLAVSIYLHSVLLFFACRLLSGFFAGGYEIAQAATADISTPETKARNMGLIICAMSIGFIIGPLITSFTAGISRFGLTMPFWIACGLSTINALLISCVFQETFIPAITHKIRLRKIFSSFMFVMVDQRLAYLSVIFFLLVCGWISFFTVLPLFLTGIFNFKITAIGFYYCLVGVGNLLAIFLVQKWALRWFTLRKIIIYSATLSGILFLLLSVTTNLSLFTVLLVCCMVVEVLSYSSFLAYFSNSVTAEEQGKAMGGSGAVSSVAFVITGMLVALLANFDVRIPIMLSGVIYVVGGIMMLCVRRVADRKV